MNKKLKVMDYLREFVCALTVQLEEDEERWGDTWLKRPREGQELRTRARFIDYFDQFENADVPVPWLKVVGEALICWIRENHPEVYLDIRVHDIKLTPTLMTSDLRRHPPGMVCPECVSPERDERLDPPPPPENEFLKEGDKESRVPELKPDLS